MTAATVVVIAMLLVVLAVGEQGGGATARRSPTSCAQAVQRLAAHLRKLDPANPKIDAGIARASFRVCTSPDAWRVQATRSDLAPALGRLVHDPTLDPDRALDALCTHLDPYDTTRLCRARQVANLAS